MGCNGRFYFDKIEPSEIKVTYTFKCFQCATSLTQEFFGAYAQMPPFPKGWTQVAHNENYGPGWACPNHTVEILVDGKPLSTA